MNLNIAYSSDDNYAQHLGVSMLSLFENNRSFKNITIYIIENNISNKNKERLLNIAEQYKREIKFIDFKEYEKKLNLNMDNYISISAYARLFLDEIVEDNKVIYLDCDSIVNGSLEELWNLDISDYFVAGVEDTVGENSKTKIGLNYEDKYINSGMLLINLEKWRENDIKSKFIEFIDYYNGNVFHHDQGTINGVLKNKILILHPKYNLMTTFVTMSRDEIMKYYKLKEYYLESIIDEAKSEAIFIHYTPAFVNRPWIDKSKHPLKYLYEEYLERTPWRGLNNYKDKRSIGEKLVSFLYNNLPFDIANEICKFIF